MGFGATPPVVGLHSIVHKTAVVGEIALIVVNTVKSEPWTESMRGGPKFEGRPILPLLAIRDATAAIIGIIVALGAVAPVFHGAPHMVQRRIRGVQTIASDRIHSSPAPSPAGAAATHDLIAHQACPKRRKFLAAAAEAFAELLVGVVDDDRKSEGQSHKSVTILDDARLVLLSDLPQFPAAFGNFIAFGPVVLQASTASDVSFS